MTFRAMLDVWELGARVAGELNAESLIDVRALIPARLAGETFTTLAIDAMGSV